MNIQYKEKYWLKRKSCLFYIFVKENIKIDNFFCPKIAIIAFLIILKIKLLK